MNKISSLFIISLLSGAVTLGAYKVLFTDSKTLNYAAQLQPTAPLKNVNFTSAPTDFSEAAENAVHFVVHVKNITMAKVQPNSLADFFYGYQSQPQQRMQIGTGSGVIVSEDGYVVTNNHVIQNSSDLEVTLNNNTTYKAKVIGTDSKMDIALLKLDTKDKLPYATFGNSDQIKLGEWVLAIGNPYNLNSTVTAGIVSAKARNLANDGLQSFIQTDAAVNPGNSGGALVNTRGELIGINTMISSTTGSYVGYSFAVPSNITRKIIEDLMQYGNVQHAALGVEGGELNSAIAEELKINSKQGFYINKVTEKTGAEKAGLKKGDVIIQLDDQKITSFSTLSSYLSSKRPEDVVNVLVIREGKNHNLPVKLSKKELLTAEYNGFKFENITPAEKKKFRINQGVKIESIENSEFQRYANSLKGSIILSVDGQQVSDSKELAKILESKNGEKLILEIITSSGQQVQLYL